MTLGFRHVFLSSKTSTRPSAKRYNFWIWILPLCRNVALLHLVELSKRNRSTKSVETQHRLLLSKCRTLQLPPNSIEMSKTHIKQKLSKCLLWIYFFSSLPFFVNILFCRRTLLCLSCHGVENMCLQIAPQQKMFRLTLEKPSFAVEILLTPCCAH